MQGKLMLFSFLAAVIVFISNALKARADKDGNVYINLHKFHFKRRDSPKKKRNLL